MRLRTADVGRDRASWHCAALPRFLSVLPDLTVVNEPRCLVGAKL